MHQGLVTSVAMVVLLSATSVHAQDVREKFHLGFGVGLLNFTKSTLEPDFAGADDIGVTRTRFGTLESGTVTLGYGVSSDVVIGAALEARYGKDSVENADDLSETVFTFLPTIDYMFPGRTARAFVGAGLGVLVGFEEEGAQEISQTAFAFQAGFGVRVFLGESLSLDPSIGAGYVIGSGTLEQGGRSVDLDVSGLGGGLSIGLSGWI